MQAKRAVRPDDSPRFHHPRNLFCLPGQGRFLLMPDHKYDMIVSIIKFSEGRMELVKIGKMDVDGLAALVAAFRTQLKSYKGIRSTPDIDAGKEEILEFLNSGFPIYAVKDLESFVGYIVCRIDEPCLWVEHIFVREDYRKRGIAAMLFEKAEEIAASMGEDTVYNYVHPNNENMIRFLRSKGYTVLNMIEIRKPYPGEKLTATIHVEKEAFDY